MEVPALCLPGFAHVPLPLIFETSQGKLGHAVPRVFSAQEDRRRKKPTDQHKIHFKDSECGECVCTHSHTHTYMQTHSV